MSRYFVSVNIRPVTLATIIIRQPEGRNMLSSINLNLKSKQVTEAKKGLTDREQFKM